VEIVVDKSFTYKAPHDIIWITDQSRFTEIAEISANAILLMPFVSDRGKDGEFAIFRGSRDLAAAEREFGAKNFRRHGQPYYQVLKTLESGGWVIGMRLVDDKATYANAVVYAEVELDGTDKIKVDLSTASLTDVKAYDTIEAQLTVTPNGTKKKFPLFCVLSKGRGAYGNDFAVRMVEDKLENSTSMYANYLFELLTNEKGTLKASENITCSLIADARSNGLSSYIESVVANYNNDVVVKVNEDVIEELMTFIKPVADAKNVKPESIDLLVPHADVTYVEITNGELLSKATGLPLKEGSDGDWAGKKFAFSGADAMPNLADKFADFYMGKINSNIFNVLKTGASYVLDANFPIKVKNAMVALVSNRIDMHAYLDCQIQKTPKAVSDWVKTFTCTNWNVSLFSQHMRVVDDASEKEITVTTPYVLSYMLPQHYRDWGSHIPMAGLEKGRVTGVIPDTIMPRVNTLADRDIVYRARCNYISEGEGYDTFEAQVTMYLYDSKLMHTNNARMLSEMAKLLLLTVRNYRFEFTEPEDIKRFVRLANDALAPYKDKVRSLEYEITQTPYQQQKGILNDVLRVLFKDIALYNKVEIVVLGNPTA
jgi:hypothetical protein